MKDRFTIGLISGAIAGIAMNVVNFISFYLFHFAKTRLLDFAAIFIYGHKPTFWWDTIFALFAQLIHASIIGLLFTYLFLLIKTKKYLLKGAFFGTASWFIIYSIGHLYRVPLMVKISWQTATSNFITISIYGLIMAVIMNWLENRSSLPQKI